MSGFLECGCRERLLTMIENLDAIKEKINKLNYMKDFSIYTKSKDN